MNIENKDICVIMSDNRLLESNKSIANYSSLASAINYNYCKKHKYNFIYYRPYLYEKGNTTLYNCIDINNNLYRYASWSKLLSIKLALKLNFKYIVYIDSDCIFKDITKKLESIINKYLDYSLLFFNNKPWDSNEACTGFIICKNCNNTKNFINLWYNYNLKSKNKLPLHEQSALKEILTLDKNKKLLDNINIKILDEWMFIEKENQFLRHVASFEKRKRIPYFTNYINYYNLNYLELINEIYIIEYDTSII